MDTNQIKRVIIVGGGTAGWLSACHLAKKLCGPDSDVSVTLVESPNIPTIGVGEGTVPAFRDSLKYLGISETDFVRECDATFKQSVRFNGWVDGTDHYHHVFDYPVKTDVDITPYYLLSGTNNPYVDAVSVQGKICELGLAPKLITDAEFNGKASYAYHLDAAKFSAFLTRHGTEKLGVTHVLADVQEITVGEDGYIDSVETDTAGTLAADFFVDCTGFRSTLLGEKLGVGFVNKNDVLFVDHAVAMQIPYGDDRAIPSSTLATAREAGWIWDIGLMDRKGTGYVYSSRYTDHDRAEKVIRDYARATIGDKADELSCRRIPMNVGYREKFWVKNCAAIGLSQGFVEPLEATGILVFDATARMLAEQFPSHRAAMPALARQFNNRVSRTWDSVINFIKLHYCISQRTDSAFWRDNCDMATVPDSLQELLEIWKYQPPSAYDFTSKLDIFNLENYLYVLYGMQFRTDMSANVLRYPDMDKAKDLMAQVSAFTDQLCNQLQPHRSLMEKAIQYGFQKV